MARTSGLWPTMEAGVRAGLGHTDGESAPSACSNFWDGRACSFLSPHDACGSWRRRRRGRRARTGEAHLPTIELVTPSGGGHALTTACVPTWPWCGSSEIRCARRLAVRAKTAARPPSQTLFKAAASLIPTRKLHSRDSEFENRHSLNISVENPRSGLRKEP